MMMILSGVSGMACASDWVFSAEMLEGNANGVDISVFNQGLQLPGVYQVDIQLNGKWVDSRTVNFSLKKEGAQTVLYPCLSEEDLARYGVDTEAYALTDASECIVLSAIPDSRYEFRFEQQLLMLTIPQIALRPVVKGVAPQQLWDDGMNVLMMNYNGSLNRNEYRTPHRQTTDSTWLQVNPGANIGPWRLRNQSNWQQTTGAQGRWQVAETWLERGFYNAKNRLTVGERQTSGEIFDPVPFRGVMLATDDNMVPWSQSAYTPLIRGIARTQARVEVKQNGYTICNEVVAPGPFELGDLPVSGAPGGELQVTVWETDGALQQFSVPWQTPAIALRNGYVKYGLMLGEYRSPDNSHREQKIGQATVIAGLPKDLTAYTGTQLAGHFQAATVGLGAAMGELGALSIDTTGSRWLQAETGGNLRVRYNKTFNATNTTLLMSHERNLSPGYLTLAQALQYSRSKEAQRKSTSTIMLSQPMGGWGWFSLNGYWADYERYTGQSSNIGIGYGIGLANGATLSVNWSENRQVVNQRGDTGSSRMLSLQLSMPIRSGFASPISASYQALNSSNSRTTQQIGLNGSAFSQHLGWDLRQQYQPGSDGNSSSARINWSDTYGQIGGSYSYSPQLRQMGINVAGGMVLHQEGATFGQQLGETVALLEAKGIAGAAVSNNPWVRTDAGGYGLQPWLKPYQENRVGIDPFSLPENADIPQTDISVVPTQGAVVKAAFTTRTGGRGLMTLTLQNGEAVPFGAMVMAEGYEGNIGIVGERGQVWLTGMPDKGSVSVKWRENSCKVDFTLPKKADTGGIYTLAGICR
ncbi:fimbria/pilus outer membrane usher protein [Enterobacter bugandensis]